MPSTFNELLKPRRVDVETINNTRSTINIEPLNRGFGHTLGNALRIFNKDEVGGDSPGALTGHAPSKSARQGLLDHGVVVSTGHSLDAKAAIMRWLGPALLQYDHASDSHFPLNVGDIVTLYPPRHSGQTQSVLQFL